VGLTEFDRKAPKRLFIRLSSAHIITLDIVDLRGWLLKFIDNRVLADAIAFFLPVFARSPD